MKDDLSKVTKQQDVLTALIDDIKQLNKAVKELGKKAKFIIFSQS